MAVHESRTGIPTHYAREGPPHPETLVDFRIALHSIDRSGLERALYDVSVPGSPLYGKHLSTEEVGSQGNLPRFYNRLTNMLCR